jgi:hypothetical protein
MSAVMIGVFLLLSLAVDRGDRWFLPFVHIFHNRFLLYEEPMAFMIDQGLPEQAVTPEMYLGFSVFKSQLFNNPAANDLLMWLRFRGRSAYFRYLISNPVRTLGQPIKRTSTFLSPDSSEFRRPEKSDPPWAAVLNDLMLPKSWALVLAGTLATVGWIVWYWSRGGSAATAAIPLALHLLAYPLAYVVWYADALELERHSDQIALQIRLSAWMLLLAAVEVTVRSAGASVIDAEL